MILSFHPCFIGDQNLDCAGRSPGIEDLTAVKAADAVILPQGCSKSLYEMVRENCEHVFPDYDVRFAYPDKIGHIDLFRKINAAYPRTETFNDVHSFYVRYDRLPETIPFNCPFVFKFNWGGEGDTVHLIKSIIEFKHVLQLATEYESSGQAGFLLQEYIPSGNRSLRVVVIGKKLISYWRIQKNMNGFYASLAKGAEIDSHADPDLQERARISVKDFCSKTGINLAGFDLLFPSSKEIVIENFPLFLEINYFFGRQGLGGSEKYYAMLKTEIDNWLNELGLSQSI